MYIILFIYENEFLTHTEQPNNLAQSSMNLTKLTWVKIVVARYDVRTALVRLHIATGRVLARQ